MMPINSLVILGGGVAGWTAAHYLRLCLPDDIEISVVDLSSVDERQYFELTPAASSFFKDQGIDEDVLIKQKSNFSLAKCYQSIDSDKAKFLPFSAVGFSLNAIDFHHYAVWANRQGKKIDFDSYSLASVAARARRFRHPSNNDNSIFSTLAYGYQLNAEGLIALLKARSLAMGVKRVDADFLAASLSTEGSIESVSLLNKSGQIFELPGQFFLDCSGKAAKLLTSSLNVPFVPEQSLSFVDTAIRFVTDADSVKPYSSVAAVEFGWQFELALVDKCHIEVLFSSTCDSPEDVIKYLADKYGVEFSQFTLARIDQGCRKAFWYKNCVAIGAAAGSLSEFGFGELSLVQSAVLRFANLFPAGCAFASLAQEYNRLTHLEYAHLIDYNQLHYYLFKNDYSRFWQQASHIKISETLSYRLELFKATGRVPFYEGDPLAMDTWTSFLLMADFWPDHYDVLVDNLDPEWILAQLQKMESTITRAATAIPTLQEYLHLSQSRV